MFLLDTDTVSHALRGEGRVGERLARTRPSEVAVSSITVCELAFGVEKRGSQKLDRIVREFLRGVEILPFDEVAAWRYGTLTASLQRTGEPIGSFDSMIAAHALVSARTLVSHNVNHFSRIEGLSWEDWY